MRTGAFVACESYGIIMEQPSLPSSVTKDVSEKVPAEREQRDEKQQVPLSTTQGSLAQHTATAPQGGNIGTIVAKSKKAAATLCTLIHAKVSWHHNEFFGIIFSLYIFLFIHSSLPSTLHSQ